MSHLITFFLCILVLVYAKPSDDIDKGNAKERSYGSENECSRITCRGEGYQCIGGQCYCADGYVPNGFLNRCVRCPGAGEKCSGPCCYYGNVTLACRQGVCQPCYDNYNNWVCHNSIENVLLVSSTQIAMATALVLGVIATFVLLYKLCAATTLRTMGSLSNQVDSRLSIGSLQVYVDERLRDAPPRYSRAAPSGSSVIPATVYVNGGFIHDNSVPPPPYTPQKDDNQNPTIHI